MVFYTTVALLSLSCHWMSAKEIPLYRGAKKPIVSVKKPNALNITQRPKYKFTRSPMPFYSIPSRTRVSKSSGFLRVTEKRWLGVAHGGHESFCATSDKIQSARITWKEGSEQKCLIHNLDVTLYSVELPLNTEDSCVYRKDIVWCNRGQLKKKIWLMQAIIGSEGIPKEMIRCMLANCMTELMEELSISVGYSQSTISDEFIQELRNSYSSLLKKEKKDEDQLLMFIICATIFYACFAIVAGYESVALLISEVKKYTQKTGQSKSKSTN